MEAFSRKVAETLSFPVFVKPTNGGSSFGISRVKTPEDLPSAVNYAFREGPMVIVEQGISGRELTCAAYFDGKSVCTLPPIEIVTENEYFDYDAKYNGMVQEITPARISDELRDRIQDLTASIYRLIGCKGIIRNDYIITEGDRINLLEVNTTPGMTETSFIPQQIKAAGLNLTDVITDIIEDSF